MARPEKPPKRLYVDAPLQETNLVLDTEQAHYLGRVLRCREGDRVVVFNAQGTERNAEIASLSKRRPLLSLGAAVEAIPEPETPLVLLQGMIKSDAMDLIVQKATELGAASLMAVRTDFSVVKLDSDERRERRLAHWRRIATSACEQSGRHRPPELSLFDSLDEAIAALPQNYARIAFDLGARRKLNGEIGGATGICVAIGPEGGFSPSEAELLTKTGFEICSLGPRTLRAETAAIAAMAGIGFMQGN